MPPKSKQTMIGLEAKKSAATLRKLLQLQLEIEKLAKAKTDNPKAISQKVAMSKKLYQSAWKSMEVMIKIDGH
ncbi:MAG: hypothetical protein AB3N15_15875 [Paracoccaceae bacterium]